MNRISMISTLNEFLSIVRYELANRTKKSRVLVLGNESCDLDSVCCSISYAYFKQLQFPDSIHIPLCCINKPDMPLRTEVTHWLKENSIDWHFLPYLDTEGAILLDDPEISNKLILVDHFKPIDKLENVEITEIIDHHKVPDNYVLPKVSFLKQELTGSCATLVAQSVLKSTHSEQLKPLLKLLYGAILIDTVGLSELGKTYGKVTEKDVEITKEIESILGNTLSSRDDTFKQIEKAKYNISGMTVAELLRRDMKMAVSDTGSDRIIVSTVSGIDLKEFVEKNEFKLDADITCAEYGTSYLVCVTAMPSDSSDSSKDKLRGIFVYTAHSKIYPISKIVQAITSPESNLNIEEVNCNFDWSPGKSDCFAGRVGNLKFSRKVLMPILFKLISQDEPILSDSSISSEPESLSKSRDNIDWISLLNEAEVILLFSNHSNNKKTLAQIKENLRRLLLSDHSLLKSKRTAIQDGITKGWHSSSRLLHNQPFLKEIRKKTHPITTKLEVPLIKSRRRKNFSTSDKDTFDSISTRSLTKMKQNPYHDSYDLCEQGNLTMMEVLGGSNVLSNESLSQLIMTPSNPNDLAEANSFNLFSRIKNSRRNTCGGLVVGDLDDLDDFETELKLEAYKKENPNKRASQLTHSEIAMLKITRERCFPTSNQAVNKSQDKI